MNETFIAIGVVTCLVCPYCGESIQTKVGQLPTKMN